MKNIYEVQRQNKIKSSLIIFFFAIFVFLTTYVLANAFNAYLGYQAGGLGFVGIALIVSGFTSFFGYYYSDSVVLSLSGARPADRKKDFVFYTVAENLAIGLGIPKPKLYVITDDSPNAFATGRDLNHAAIAVTSGLLEKLNRTELEGVIGHEMTHIRNFDTRLASIVSVMVGFIALFSDWFLRMSYWSNRNKDEKDSGLGAIFILLGIIFSILSPIVAQLIQLAISRRREFMADAGSVEITRQPQGLINALKKISDSKLPLKSANKATAHLYISNPMNLSNEKKSNWLVNLFNTHPPIADRIKALQNMA